MNCQYCGKEFNRSYNRRRHEDEYCSLREQNNVEYDDEIPRKKFRYTESDEDVSTSPRDDESTENAEESSENVETGDDENSENAETGDDENGENAETGDDENSENAETGDDENGENAETGDDENSENAETGDDENSENSKDDGEIKEEIDPWATMIDDAKVTVRPEYDELLKTLQMDGQEESVAKQKAFEKILPELQKEFADVYLDNLRWIKALKKDPVHRKIMETKETFVNEDSFDPNEALSAAVDKRKFLLKRLLEDQGRFSDSDDDQ